MESVLEKRGGLGQPREHASAPEEQNEMEISVTFYEG